MNWKDRALNAIKTVANNQSTVHVDDVLAIFNEPPFHPNHWGVVWKVAIKENIIQPTSEYKHSTVPIKHKRRVRVYASLCTSASA
mgnify:CR=1 FL=1